MPGHPNSPPVAKAGEDQNIFLPTSSVTLIGELSADPDGSIISYWWSQLSGPNQSVILNPNASNTVVTGLVEGRYQFRLKVTDNSGETGNDTVAVVVNPWPQSITVFPAQVTWLTPLSIWRVGTTGATAGDKVLFAGGISIDWDGYITGFFSRVDIYDYTTNIWSTAELSQARYHMAAAAAGNKIVFAGGETASGQATTRVDIYDVATNTWSIAELSTPRKDIAAASSGSKILFVGGDAINSDGFITGVFSTVEYYDVITNRWSTATLSEARGSILAGSAGAKILFAGGLTTSGPPSNRVDIYDASTGVWSTASLSQAEVFEAVTTVGNKVIYADKNQVTVYDAASKSWSIESLNPFDSLSSGIPYFTGAVTAGNLAAFFSPDIRRRFLIYSAVGQIWGVSSEVEILFDGWDAFVAANNQIFIAGWEGVRRVQF